MLVRKLWRSRARFWYNKEAGHASVEKCALLLYCTRGALHAEGTENIANAREMFSIGKSLAKKSTPKHCMIYNRTRMDLSHSRRFYYMSGRFFQWKGFGLFKKPEHVP